MGPVKELDAARIRHELGVTRKDFARLTGYSERSIASWEGGEEPSAKGLQRLNEAKRLALRYATRRRRLARRRTRLPARPLEVIERGGSRPHRRMITTSSQAALDLIAELK
jgi:transcriptional regulator with XRE-family HTH domain